MKVNDSYKKSVIKDTIKGKVSNKKAAEKLDLSIRQIQRLKKRYRDNNGDLTHKNKGKPPINKTSKEKETEILNLYTFKYFNFNFSHFNDCLKEYEKISVPYNLVYRILNENGFISPKHHHKRGKDNTHPLRERRKHFGELIQIDASIHNWFGMDLPKASLHGAIDDATSKVVGLYFDEYETLNGYYNVLFQILTKYGIPEAFYGDNRTVFEYIKKKIPDTENTNIQFKRCCGQLGIELITTSVSQAKGRIERLWNTLQSRLLNELRLNNIKDIKTANAFLPDFIKRFNDKFSIEALEKDNYFVEAPKKEDVCLYLSIIVNRKILDGNRFKYKNHSYQCIDTKNKIVILDKGTIITVIETFDHMLIVECNGHIYDVKNIEYDPRSQVYVKKGRKHIPQAANHPWRRFIINPKKK